MIKIDFHGSTHGHFLEYVTNVYIMQTTASKTNIFKPPTYSAHAPDHNYLDNRLIVCGHFSNPAHKGDIDKDDTVIRITIDPNNDKLFFVALTNLMFKAGDIEFETKMLNVPQSVRDDPVALRNNWFSKFNERHTFANFYAEFNDIDNPIFEFQFHTFFCFSDFCAELSRLSEFLQQVFCPDQSLYDLWREFIHYNQGWQSWTKCNHLLENILSNGDVNIECSVLEQGWINYNLSKICRMYSGPVFDSIVYPTNSQSVYRLVQDHNQVLKS